MVSHPEAVCCLPRRASAVLDAHAVGMRLGGPLTTAAGNDSMLKIEKQALGPQLCPAPEK
jgi:hypothetical protein